MNTFVRIELVERYDFVNYYSVALEDADENLFQKFVAKHAAENTTKLNHIMAWLDKIGNEAGAERSLFRPESSTAETYALPPHGKGLEPVYIEYDDETGEELTSPNPLRLYCFRANEHVVILFSGDVKTANTAQDCPNVRNHFQQANALSKCLDEHFRDKIVWKGDYTDIVFEEDIKLACNL